MAPLIALILGFAASRLLGLVGVDAWDGWQQSLCVGLSLMFVVTGLAHFIGRRRKGLVAMVPPGLPKPELLVLVTGVLELAGAVGLWIDATAQAAAICLALLMLVMFPANVSAARRHLPVTPLPIRIPLQVVFVGAAVAAAI